MTENLAVEVTRPKPDWWKAVRPMPPSYPRVDFLGVRRWARHAFRDAGSVAVPALEAVILAHGDALDCAVMLGRVLGHARTLGVTEDEIREGLERLAAVGRVTLTNGRVWLRNGAGQVLG
ncbi:MAG: hypothetical protein M3Y77_07260 [Actinomycetota bacterium]|nr:hypothetical protein [Actinomycetota bacterium]